MEIFEVRMVSADLREALIVERSVHWCVRVAVMGVGEWL